MRRAQPESLAQQGMVKALRLKGYFVAHVPNGSKWPGTKKQRMIRGARLKKEGLVAGFPDLLIYGRDGFHGLIEVKSMEGSLTSDQKEVLEELGERGFNYAVCRTIDEAISAVEGWAK